MTRFVEDKDYQTKVLENLQPLIALEFLDKGHRFPAYKQAAKVFDCELREDVGMKAHYIRWLPDATACGGRGFECCHPHFNGDTFVEWWNSNEFEAKFRMGMLNLEPCQQRILLAKKYDSLQEDQSQTA